MELNGMLTVLMSPTRGTEEQSGRDADAGAPCLGLNLSSATYWPYDLGQITAPL